MARSGGMNITVERLTEKIVQRYGGKKARGCMELVISSIIDREYGSLMTEIE